MACVQHVQLAANLKTRTLWWGCKAHGFFVWVGFERGVQVYRQVCQLPLLLLLCRAGMAGTSHAPLVQHPAGW